MRFVAGRGDDPISEARRRLLKRGVYAVPAVLTVVAVRSAGVQATSGPPGQTMIQPPMATTMGNPMGNSGMG
jgi:hypothetical protein